MDKLFGHAFLNDPAAWGNGQWGENQLVSIVVLTIALILIAITLFVLIKKTKVNMAPSKLVVMVEQYVIFIDDVTDTTTDSKLNKLAPYFFSLFTFLAIGNAMDIFGLAPLATSLTFVFTITIITWIGTIVVGVIFQKWSYWKEWINPLDWTGKIAPLLSLSFRMFGNITGGVLLMTLLDCLFNFIWSKIIQVDYSHDALNLNLIAVLILPWLSLYFDIFDSILQGFVFTLLTMSYWSMAARIETKEHKKRSISSKMKKMTAQQDVAVAN